MRKKVFNHFETVAGVPVSTKDLVIPANKTFIIEAVDFSGPGGQSFMKFEHVGGDTLSASRGDKFVCLPSGGLQVEGPATLRSTLDNIGGGNVEMGMAVYYEEL